MIIIKILIVLLLFKLNLNSSTQNSECACERDKSNIILLTGGAPSPIKPFPIQQ